MALRNVAIEANDDEQRREDGSGSHGGHKLNTAESMTRKRAGQKIQRKVQFNGTPTQTNGG
jgi:hypothetical protein